MNLVLAIAFLHLSIPVFGLILLGMKRENEKQKKLLRDALRLVQFKRY